ncbi:MULTISPECIES: hypothetical protein [Asaia]|uniref:hypothetical protein n=1 Tax=Asaia TaxID=91914 RepID=UPI001267FDDB|nr:MULTISPECIES: hypothetical protein [Asaia]
MADTAAVLVDCFSVVHMHLPLATPDACVAARAAIRAAEIQAKATRYAGGLTLISGIAALFAGLLAVAAAVADQVNQRRAERRRRQAYFRRMLNLFDQTEGDLLSLKNLFSDNKSLPAIGERIFGWFLVNSGRENEYAHIMDLMDVLSKNNWEEMSLFSEQIMGDLFDLSENLKKTIYNLSIIRDNTKCEEITPGATATVTFRPWAVQNAACAGIKLVETIESLLKFIRSELARELKL